MKIFERINQNALVLKNKKNVQMQKFFSELEREIIIMFCNWVKPGFAIEYQFIQITDYSSGGELITTGVKYSVLFRGTEDSLYVAPISSIVVYRKNPEHNVNTIIQEIEKLIKKFFNTVEAVKKKNTPG